MNEREETLVITDDTPDDNGAPFIPFPATTFEEIPTPER